MVDSVITFMVGQSSDFFMFLHMFTVFFTQAYRPPREMTWLTGIGLLDWRSPLDFPDIFCRGTSFHILPHVSEPV